MVLALCCSCRSAHEAMYLDDAVCDSAYAIRQNYSTTLRPGDRLSIQVASQTPENVLSLNQETNRLQGARTAREETRDGIQRDRLAASLGNAQGYVVNQRGVIQFPFLGVVAHAGMSLDSLASLLQQALIDSGYVQDPIVTVRLMNFHVSVVGEVLTPVIVQADGHRLTLLEALAQAGDVSIYGRRDRIHVVRDENGKAVMGTVDLTQVAFLDSPYYYLQPNDIVYVEPNDRRKHESRDEAFLSNVRQASGIMRTAVDAARRLTEAQVINNR